MAKYNVVEVIFKAPVSCLGGSAWMQTVKQGGYAAIEYDSNDRMLTLSPGDKPGVKKRRIPVENISDMVYGVTTTSNKE